MKLEIMNKTLVLQTVIDKLKKEQVENEHIPQTYSVLKRAIDICTSLLPEAVAQLEDAWKDGYNRAAKI